MVVLLTVIFALASMVFYRAGGQGKHPSSRPTWMPMWLRHKWVRDGFCTLLTIGWALIFLPKVAWFWYVLAAGAQYGLTTTYWDDVEFVNWMFPKDNYYLHGFGIRLAFMFIAIPAGVWWQCFVSAVVLGLFMGIWCEVNTNDVAEEFGRGGAIQASLPLLML